MRYLKVLLISLLFTGCASTEKKSSDSSQIYAGNLWQHAYVAGIMANYFCANNRWPQTINELEFYSKKNPTPMDSKINWEQLSKNEVTFKVKRDVYLRTPAKKSEGIISVRSVHQYPDCKGDSIKVNFHPTMGD